MDDPELTRVTLPASTLGEEALPPVIGDYRLVRRIGEGGMGAVYLAEQQHPRREVALKVIKAGVVDAAMLRRFDREAELLGRLQHPGIAQIYEAGTADTPSGPRPFFAMEFIHGESLRRHVAGRQPSLRQRLELMVKICEAVNHAHHRGVIHRDLKPANIIVDHTGQPKVLDFGVARLADADRRVTRQTDVGQLVGTLAYMSPEQVSADPASIDIRSDVYALGVMLYELLAGRLPYDVESKALPAAMQAICDEEPTSLGSLSSAYRGDVEVIVAKAMEKDRERRYGSAADLAADLQRHLNYEPVTARRPSLAYQLQKFARRHTAFVAGVAAVLAVLVAGTIVSAWQAVRARRAEIAAEQRFDNVRTLAGTLLFDLHDAIRDLAGAIPARRLLLSNAQKYLEILSNESTGNPGLEHELMVAYDRVADLLGNPLLPNLGDAAGAKASYEKGLAIADRLLAADPRDAVALRERAILLSKLGDMAFGAGDVKLAMARHREGAALMPAVLAANPGDQRSLQTEVVIQQRLCGFLPATGDMAAAEKACDDSIRLLAPLLERDPRNRLLRRMSAVSHGSLGGVFRLSGRMPQALPELQKAARLFEELSSEEPMNADYLRQTANIGVYIAPALAQTGDLPAALATYEKTVTIYESLLPREVDDSRMRTVLAFTLRRYSELLEANARSVQARALMARSFAVQEPLVRRPDATVSAINEYADALLKCKYPELRKDKEALALMVEVDRRTKSSNPLYLDTLAWAYYRNGDSKRAIATAEHALTMVPPGQASMVRSDLEQGLAEFKKGQ